MSQCYGLALNQYFLFSPLGFFCVQGVLFIRSKITSWRIFRDFSSSFRVFSLFSLLLFGVPVIRSRA